MCIGSSPKLDPLPIQPTAPRQPERQAATAAQSREASAAGDEERRRLRASTGPQSTIMTGSRGISDTAPVKKTILGG